jgi:hypothetical protein
MRVFVIGTGRCGTVTFSKACRHIQNYTCSHESNTGWKPTRPLLEYPDNHIEVDPRLSYFLPLLIQKYPDAYFVHLIRNREDTIKSLEKRESLYLFGQFHMGISKRSINTLATLYYDNTVNMVNMLSDHTNNFQIISLEDINNGYKLFWERINAKGDYGYCLKEFKTKYNKS